MCVHRVEVVFFYGRREEFPVDARGFRSLERELFPAPNKVRSAVWCFFLRAVMQPCVKLSKCYMYVVSLCFDLSGKFAVDYFLFSHWSPALWCTCGRDGDIPPLSS